MGLFSPNAETLTRRLKRAIEAGSTERVKKLIDAGASAKAQLGYYSPLLDAVNRDRPEIVKLLLIHGADPNECNRARETPLGQAAAQWNGNAVIAQMLFEHGADFKRASIGGITPLSAAVCHNNKALARLLLEKGVDPNGTDGRSYTPLHHAADMWRGEILDLLLEYGADVNARTLGGVTPLHFAAKDGYTEIVEKLLSRGADASLADNLKNTPAHLAAKDYPALSTLLREACVPERASPAVPETNRLAAEIHIPAAESYVPAAQPRDDVWRLVAAEEVARVIEKAAIGYRITETFNFRSNIYTHLARNLETGAESQSVKTFNDLQDSGLVSDARAALEKRGGKVPLDADGFSSLDKRKPALTQKPAAGT